MDEQRREYERAANAGDADAQRRVEHERCRAGEHCAHSHESVVPPLPPAGQTALVTDFHVEINGHLGFAHVDKDAHVTFRVIGLTDRSLQEALQWLRHVFQPRYAEPIPLGRVLYGSGFTPEHPDAAPKVATNRPASTTRLYTVFDNGEWTDWWHSQLMAALVDREVVVRCPRCHGQGGPVVECAACDDTGRVTLSRRTVATVCSICHKRMCDHTAVERAIPQDEMFEPIEFTDHWEHA